MESGATTTSALLAPITSHVLDSTQAAVQAAHASRRTAIFSSLGSNSSSSSSSASSASNSADVTIGNSMDISSSSSTSSSSSSSNDNRNKRRRGQAVVEEPVKASMGAEDANFLNGQLVSDYLELAAADPVIIDFLFFLLVTGILAYSPV